jgi:hypothetical protein
VAPPGGGAAHGALAAAAGRGGHGGGGAQDRVRAELTEGGAMCIKRKGGWGWASFLLWWQGVEYRDEVEAGMRGEGIGLSARRKGTEGRTKGAHD